MFEVARDYFYDLQDTLARNIFLIIYLRKCLYTVHKLDISVDVERFAWHQYESLDLTKLFKKMTDIIV